MLKIFSSYDILTWEVNGLEGKDFLTEPDIRPMSELRHYRKVLKDVVPGHPVILTKNGYGKYVILAIKDYRELIAIKRELEEDDNN
ncbi:type II toxin-antitoxin system Phd/YefM family antitoxin [Lacticaseibacillus porcinae]|uniref:type II toxin-antitoxin system Phd/YefM family antitoxin n=1 Tax=Lacticaseibacillus porcinae TaxID=1123687 RepID=UPI000F782A0B|nr:type II toxin-antitoxin system Phd/YefM family antitoxin [Lacticaseibacillus porcinae]